MKNIKIKLHTFRQLLTAAVEEKSLLLCLMAAPVLNLLIESMSRHSLWKGLLHMADRPMVYLFNSLLILSTLLIAACFRKRLFAMLFMGMVWLWGGIVNGVLLSMRVTPFGFSDFRNIEQAIDIVDIYMTHWQIALCCAALGGCIFGLVLLYIKSPRMPARYLNGGAAAALCVLLLCLLGGYCIDQGHLSEEFTNLADAYQDYGFVYCFTKSVFDQGVDRPQGYSGDRIENIVDALEKEEETIDPPLTLRPALKEPNLIVVQLESFFDVTRMKDLGFSHDPIPHFRAMMAEGPSGFLTVPSIGAGTVNTEFEVLTGMSLDHFGTGEYPYKTILRSSVAPSLCYDLQSQNYESYAIHNNNGTFYDRHKVYPNLGFSHFISIEYMDNIRENALGWAKDSILTEQILKCLDDGIRSDFVYTVAVQPHGRYPKEIKYEDETGYPIKVTGLESQAERNQWEYYVSQLQETDLFVAELKKALDARGEPYICLFYGDHFPSLDILDEELSSGNVYQTEYAVCTNVELKDTADQDLEAYQLAARLLEMADLEGGVLTDLHRTAKDDPDYEQRLELLEYDLLYGDKSALEGYPPMEPTEMQMGVDPVILRSAVLREDGLHVFGDGLTDECYVFINGKPADDQIRREKDRIIVPDSGAEPGDILTLAMMGGDGEPLGYSNEYLLN